LESKTQGMRLLCPPGGEKFHKIPVEQPYVPDRLVRYKLAQVQLAEVA
jgi:hypothetical protein